MLKKITHRMLLVLALFGFSSVAPVMASNSFSDMASSALGNIEKLNINTASIADFAMIKGLGEKKAGEIVKYRETYGKFKKIEDLLNVTGIGKMLLEKIRPFLSL
ncbi:competence protein CelA [Psychromonas sp. CNPT3]|uniref:ComEA family DNA-binding protein n=1 Tax=Psychromonas sp. CNPT3 TaxID=314282 RepID=UPI00006E9577|nr:helix-hairpin-helix domain-containing protein [Psychromonas sp. CNPT3]AGH80262.1 competence protein CelA [Psychromonas sp. CNPT3]